MTERELLVFAPGLATKGRSERIIRKVVTELNKVGKNIEILKVEYPSHTERKITKFERDLENLEEKLRLAQQTGRIIACGVCYGAYLLTRLNFDNDKTILVEPYFGHQSLRQPYKTIANITSSLPKELGRLVSLPVTHKGVITHQIDLFELAKFTKIATSPNKNWLLINTGYHHFFNTQIGQTYSLEDMRKEDPAPLTEIIKTYLEK